MDKTKIAVNIFNKLAKQYEEKFMDVSLYSLSFDFFCNSIKINNAEILELACGPGNITKYLLNRRPDFKMTGIDLSQNMIDLAAINNPGAEFQLMDCRDISAIDKKHDAIMCGFCMPYLSKEEAIKLIGDASNLLKPKGVIYISTMEGDYLKSGFEKGSTGEEIFMHYHQADYLSAALEVNNFKIINLQRKIYEAKKGIITTDLILIAEKE